MATINTSLADRMLIFFMFYCIVYSYFNFKLSTNNQRLLVIVEGEIIKSKWEGKWGKWEWKYVGKEAKRVVVQ
jgi:hypothetical protein